MTQVFNHIHSRRVTLRTPKGFQLPEFPSLILPRRIFTTTFFDTKNYDLGRLGITLQRRMEHHKSHWQLTLPNVSECLELEMPGSPSSLPRELRDLLLAHFRNEDPVAIAKLRTERHGIQVLQNGKILAEISQNSVALLDGRTIKRRLYETRLQLLDGNEHDLHILKEALIKKGAFEEDPRPMVFQALDVVFDDSASKLSPSFPPTEHLKSILQSQVRLILFYDVGTRLGEDPEDLHQMRVATRRFRALLRTGRALLDPEWMDLLRKEVGWLGGILGTVRDYDVLLEDLHHELGTLHTEDQHVLQQLLTILVTQREEARVTMLETLSHPRYLMLLNQLEYAVVSPETIPTDLTLRQIASNQFKRLCRIANKWDKHCSDENLHQIRKRAKRGPLCGRTCGSLGWKTGWAIYPSNQKISRPPRPSSRCSYDRTSFARTAPKISKYQSRIFNRPNR